MGMIEVIKPTLRTLRWDIDHYQSVVKYKDVFSVRYGNSFGQDWNGLESFLQQVLML